ncbi:MAG: SDR family NAD(P)-dependent oxidoreductase [Acetobacteraceae bacterium]
MGELSGRAALVTGAAQGIGRATAAALADAGCAVTIADIDAELGESAAKEIAGSGGRALFVRTDVTVLADLEAATEQTLATFGTVDILINNAARAIGGVVDEIDEVTWNTVLSTNLTSVWRGMKCVVPHMRRQRRGAIVNLSSVQSLTGFHGWAAYAAAKGGINALTQQAALDLAPSGIRVNAVAPGTIMTPMNERIFRDLADPQALIDRWNAAHPIGRFGRPEEVAEAVLFLASDRAAFITGTLLKVDGGLMIKGD